MDFFFVKIDATKEIAASMRNTNKSILPISIDSPAISYAPKTKAIIAKIKKEIDVRTIYFSASHSF